MKLLRIISEIKQIPYRIPLKKSENRIYPFYFIVGDKRYFIRDSTSQPNEYWISLGDEDLINLLKSKNIPYSERHAGQRIHEISVKKIYFKEPKELSEIKQIGYQIPIIGNHIVYFEVLINNEVYTIFNGGETLNSSPNSFAFLQAKHLLIKIENFLKSKNIPYIKNRTGIYVKKIYFKEIKQ